MKKLSPSDIIDIAIHYCNEQGINYPSELKSEFLAEFSDIQSIKTPRELADKICLRLNSILYKDRDVDFECKIKYIGLYHKIRDEVRWRVEFVLVEGAEILKKSFEPLPPGEPWVASSFTATTNGRHFYDRFVLARKRKLNEALVREMIGNEEAEKLFKTHPFRHRMKLKKGP